METTGVVRRIDEGILQKNQIPDVTLNISLADITNKLKS